MTPKMSNLLCMKLEEVEALEKELWDNWKRVSKALEVIKELGDEEE